MGTVYLNRAKLMPNNKYDFIFLNDAGASGQYEEYDNVDVRIVSETNLPSYLNYLLGNFKYDIISVCFLPNILELIARTSPESKLVYELHNPIKNNLGNEISCINPELIDEVWVPSKWQKEMIESLLPRKRHLTIKVKENIYFEEEFKNHNDNAYIFGKRQGQIPLLWIGRAENYHKNYHDLFRILNQLPEKYYGILVLSLDNTPGGMAELLGLASAYGIEDRLDIIFNINHEQIRNLYAATKEHKGIVCSTSLFESFGYSILESQLAGLDVVAYNVGPIEELGGDKLHLIDIGDVNACVDKIRKITANLK